MRRLSLSAVAMAAGITLGDTGERRLWIEHAATVDEERRAGDEPGADEVDHRAGDVIGRADSSERRFGGAPLLLPRLDGDRSRRDPADADLGREGAREDAGEHRLRRLGRAVRTERGPGRYAPTSSIITTSPRLDARRCGTAAWVTKKLPLAVESSAA